MNGKANDTMSTAVVSLGVNTPYEIKEICFDANNPSLKSAADGYDSISTLTSKCGACSLALPAVHTALLGRAFSTARAVLQAAYHCRVAR